MKIAIPGALETIDLQSFAPWFPSTASPGPACGLRANPRLVAIFENKLT